MISEFREVLRAGKTAAKDFRKIKKASFSLMKANGLIKYIPSSFSQFDKKCYLCL